MDIVSASISSGVSSSSEATIVGGCTQVAGSDGGTTVIAGVVVVLGIRVAIPGDSSLLVALGNGDSDGSITDIDAIIEFDCCCDEPLLLLLLLLPATVELTTSVDSRFRSSSELTKSSSSLV